ncbi:MAG: hypothetical protein V3S19_04950 [Gemmatimonadales bacterium]
MSPSTLRSLALVIATSVGVSATASGQDNLARTYTVKPKVGMGAQFEAALGEHAQWRIANNDPWTWGVSMVETGENLGTYGIRSGGHSWTDFDAYDAGFGPQGLVHWNATVAPLVESITSTISSTDDDLSRRPPEGFTLAFVTVTKFQLRPGRQVEFNQLVRQATEILKEGGFPGYWVWSSPVSGGGPGPYTNLVGLNSSWGDMADPDPSMEAVLMAKLGQEGFMEWIKNLGATYRGVESYTLRLRPDLSVRSN